MSKLAVALLCAFAFAVHAADVVVLSGGAVKSAFTAASTAWQGTSGHKVDASFAAAGEIRERIAKGEVPDLLVVPQENLAEYAKAGLIDESARRDLGAVGIAVAVKEGAPKPDISSPEALKRTLEKAKSVTYMDPKRGTSGKHFDEAVLPALGIRDEVRAKTIFGEGGFIADKVARGEAEIVIHQQTEILPVKGVTIVGPLPGALQKTTVYSGVVTKSAKHPREAQALLDYLVSPEGRKAFLDRGFTAP
jgi:molybdate transport system substrate-binding protein